ncbi:MAG: hydroxyacylglutathione hydrolase [Pseudomonadales bacterium]
MGKLEVHMLSCLQDNYAFLVHESENDLTAVIDTPEVGPINRALEEKGWRLTHILNTHHHFDHAGGNLELKDQWQCTIVGPRADRDRIPGIDVEVGDGDTYAFGNCRAQVFDVPGHTRGHIAYYFAEDGVTFVGDTLFALGCGRLFEGTPQQMWSSLEKLIALPDDTVVYCAHEYTQSNARFAVTVEPGNEELLERAEEIDRLRKEGIPTIPTTMGLEKRTNPFLRPMSANLQETVGLVGAPLAEVFGETRRRKDRF